MRPRSRTAGVALLVVLSSVAAPRVRAQVPDLYDLDTLRTIELTFHQTTWWEQLTANYGKDIDIKADLTVDGLVYQDVGVRFKGNASYRGTGTSKKKSFNVTVDSFVPGQSVQGYETLNLHNSYKDPTFVREAVSYHFLRKYMPAPKSNFVKLVINKENWGIYGNVQQVNKECIAEWFDEEDGARFKPETGGPKGGSSLVWLGADPGPYKQSFTLKSDSPETVWNDLIRAVDVLNRTPLGNLPFELPKVVHVDRALWYVAALNVLVSLDSYLGSSKNFYLYFDPLHGRMSILPWDFNEAFGKNSRTMSIPQLQRLPLFYQATNSGKPLISRPLAVPAWRERYVHHVRAMLTDFDWTVLGPLVTRFQNLIRKEVQADQKKLYPYELFNKNVTEDVRLKDSGPMDTPGLKPFTDIRRAWLLGLPELARTFPTLSDLRHTPASPKETDTVWITAKMIAAGGVTAATLYWRVRGVFTRVPMFDDGQHGDGRAGDDVFGAATGRLPAGSKVDYYVSAEARSGGAVSFLPRTAAHLPGRYQVELNSGGNSVVLNEFLAINHTGKVDEKGEHEDWLELFNPTSTAISVSGMYLTDNLAMPTKWPIPAGHILPPGATLLVWADEDQEDGPLHANFKLGGSRGEEIGLIDVDGKTLLDSIQFGPQQPDISTGRLLDGKTPWVTFAAPTPYVPNQGAGCGVRAYSALLSTAHPVALSVAADPKIGGPLALRYRQAPASSALYSAIALGGAYLPLDATRAWLLTAPLVGFYVPTSSAGSADLSLPIPDDPQLVGQMLYMQALGIDPGGLALSNAIEITFCPK